MLIGPKLFLKIFSQKTGFNPVLHSDYPGGIPGDKVYLKIMIKVPVNLIRKKSPLEVHPLNDSIIHDVVKCRQSVYGALCLPHRVFVAVIT